jgi:RNA polymerase sigma-70 factor (ECF subfamily)
MTKNQNISSLNKESFEKLFKEYFKPLTSFAFKFVKDIDDAKSIVHDVFMKLWKKKDEIDMSRSVKSYLFTSVNNRSLNFIRDHKKFTDDEFIMDIQHDENWEPANEMTADEIQKKVDATLESISPKVKQVFQMSRNEGLKYKEIAEKLGISVKTVETHMSTALKALRENLKEYLTVLILFLLNNMN